MPILSAARETPATTSSNRRPTTHDLQSSAARRPTAAELKAQCLKPGSDLYGNWMARRIARPLALRVTWLAVRLGLSANQVTLIALVVGCLAAAAMAAGTCQGLVGAAVLLQIWYLLDHVDGQLARYTGTASLAGAFFDFVMHYVVHMALGFALGLGQFARTGQPLWLPAGFTLGGALAMLMLAHDCRYKAFFRRLKRERGVFRVEGGSGARPEPPRRPPRRPAPLAWYLLQKFCEIHVIMNLLGAVAIVSLVRPSTALTAQAWLTAGWAIAVPLVAAVKVTRAITSRSIDREFAAWFQPWDD